MRIRINTKKIKALYPCQNRLDNWLLHHEKFDGDLVDFLRLPNITYFDKVWVACRVMPRFLVEVFALDCAAAANAADAAAASHAAYAAASYAAATASDAASYAAAAASTATAAAAAADGAAIAAAAVVDAAAANAERQRQGESIIYLVSNTSKRECDLYNVQNTKTKPTPAVDKL